MDKFASACSAFGLTISIKKTEVMGQNVEAEPEIFVDNQKLVVPDNFTYLGSTMTDSLSLNKEIDKRIGRASGMFSQLKKRVWENKKLTIKTKIAVYRACVLSTLLYGSEPWAAYAVQEKRLNTLQLRHLKLILGIQWHHRVTSEVLSLAGIVSLYSLLKQRMRRWLGHVRRMDDGRIPKDLLYGELGMGKRSQGRPIQCFRNVCKNDIRECKNDTQTWESMADGRDLWKRTVKEGTATFESNQRKEAEVKRKRRKEKSITGQSHPPQNSDYVYNLCGRDCGAFIGLHNHTRKCSRTLSN